MHTYRTSSIKIDHLTQHELTEDVLKDSFNTIGSTQTNYSIDVNLDIKISPVSSPSEHSNKTLRHNSHAHIISPCPTVLDDKGFRAISSKISLLRCTEMNADDTITQVGKYLDRNIAAIVSHYLRNQKQTNADDYSDNIFVRVPRWVYDAKSDIEVCPYCVSVSLDDENVDRSHYKTE